MNVLDRSEMKIRGANGLLAGRFGPARNFLPRAVYGDFIQKEYPSNATHIEGTRRDSFILDGLLIKQAY